jgi:hypothetical protein
MIQDVHPGSDPGSGYLLFTHPGSRIRGSKRHQVSDPDPQHWFQVAQQTGHFEHVERRHIFPLRLYNVVTDVLFSANFVKQGVFNVVTISILKSVLRIRIQDPGSRIRCLFDTWIWDLGWVKSPDPGSGSGMNNPDHISYSLETIFGLKYLNSLMRIRDPEWKKMGSGMEKNLDPGLTSRIRNTA